jgi:hypothetical protein
VRAAARGNSISSDGTGGSISGGHPVITLQISLIVQLKFGKWNIMHILFQFFKIAYFLHEQ